MEPARPRYYRPGSTSRSGNIPAYLRNTCVSPRKGLSRKEESRIFDSYEMMLHDLNAPITTMLLYMESINDYIEGETDMELSLMLSGMCRSGMKMIDVVNDIIAKKPLENEAMVIEKSPQDLGDIIREVKEAFYPAIGKKGLVLVSRIDDGLPKAMVDRLWIYRAVSNLMQNAVNYTPQGGMISLNAEAALNDTLAIHVSDSGIGIPREEHEKIFRKYYRSAAVSGIKGSGIGLSIVNEVAGAHGGYVELESIEGIGSTFTLHLPVYHRTVL